MEPTPEDETAQAGVEEKKFSPPDLLRLVDYTLGETITQMLAITHTYASLLESPRPYHIKARREHIDAISRVSLEGIKQTRAIQCAIKMGIEGKPIPVMKHAGENLLIALDQLKKSTTSERI